MNSTAFQLAPSNPGFSRQAQVQQMIQLWQTGQHQACLQLAEQIVAAFPQEGVAWKLLGVLYPVFGSVEQTLAALQTAHKLLPKDAEVALNLGNHHAKQAQYDAAVHAYKKAIRLQPNFAQAYENLGSVLHLQGDLEAARKAFGKAIAYQPDSPLAQAELGLILHKQGKPKQAMPYYRQALQLNPADAITHYNLAQALEDVQDDAAAQASYEQALLLQADYLDALFNLGYLHKRHQRYAEANQYFTRILQLSPEHERALQVLADSYLEKGEIHLFVSTYLKAVGEGNAFSAEKMNDMVAMLLDKDLPNEAEQYCQMALEKAPDSPLILNNMGLICYARNDPYAAIGYFERAIQAKPDFAPAYSNGALPLLRVGKVNEALGYLHKAVALNPDYFAAYVNLGMAYSDFGNIPQALEYLEKALAIKPDNIKPIQSILFLSAYHPDKINARYYELLTAFGRLTAQSVQPFKHWRVAAQPARLKIGFVSGDLKHHPVGLFLKPLLANLDPAAFDVFIYSNSVLEDKVTGELKSMVSGWRVISHLNDEMAARRIQEDGVHILIDLSGHTSLNRLPMFAWKPAPLQMTWLGYWASTGMPAIDYLIADEVSVPAEAHAQFSEQVAYLPQTRFCFSKPLQAPAVNPLPALTKGYVTLGCYHKYTKATDEVIALWCEVLKQLPDARLRWQTTAFGDQEMVQAAQARFAACGIDTSRCQFLPAVGVYAYLQSHAEVDFILDTFPFTGGTTTCDALWMGVPTLTMAGQTLIARQGASLMAAAGLPDWVVHDQAAFVQQAVAFASDLSALAQTRAQLRARLQDSPLFDGARFTTAFAGLMTQLWQQRVKVATPEQFVEADLPLLEQEDSLTPLYVVAASRCDEQAFWQQTALGQSLRRHMQKDRRIHAMIAYQNTRGLPAVYNQAIADLPAQAAVLLVHDDVWLDESALHATCMAALAQFDIAGVAGCRQRLPGQPDWQLADTAGTAVDAASLLGSVASGPHAFGKTRVYGDQHVACALLDGVAMLMRKHTFDQLHGLDERYDFNVFELDLCRSAETQGYRVGVWPLALTHQGGRSTGSAGWFNNVQHYLRKWEQPDAIVQMPLSSELRQVVEEVFDLALQAHEQGDLAQAEQLYREILRIDAAHAHALHNLALILWAPDSAPAVLAEALQAFKQAHQLAPATWQFASSYLRALVQFGQTAQAQACMQALDASHQQAALTLAAELGLDMGDGLDVAINTEAAIAQSTPAMNDADTRLTDTPAVPALDGHNAPDAETQQQLLALFEQHHYAAMETQLRKVLHTWPDWLDGWKMLSDNLLMRQLDARAPAQRALQLNPHDAREHCYYGLVLKAQGALLGAAQAFAQAVLLQPDYAAAWNNWGLVLKDSGQVAEAVVKFEQALQLQPDYAECFSNLLFCLSHVEHVPPAQLLDLHQCFAERYELPLMSGWQPFAQVADPHRVIKIGFVSADFRAHSMAHFLLPVLPLLAQQPQLQLYAYASQHQADTVTAEMQASFAVWQQVADWSDEALANKIRQDQIDILIDLSGHTAGNRLLTFARKPAPIQLSWLGYLHSSGLRAMDYYLTDTLMAPPGLLDTQFSEQLVQLPVFGCYSPHPLAPDCGPLPALRNGYVTFACFNRPNKINAVTVQLWAGLLRAMPDSRLLLGGMAEDDSTQYLMDWFAAEGVDSQRIECVGRTDIVDYLASHQRVDVCLDTWPSSGVTTTAHALWMGVPTLCMQADSLRSRGAMALMQHAGLSDWIASDASAFVNCGLQQCQSLTALAALRAGLRQQLQKSPLLQPAPLVHLLTEALQTMWQRWCTQQPAVSFQMVADADDQPGHYAQAALSVAKRSDSALVMPLSITEEASMNMSMNPPDTALLNAQALLAQGNLSAAHACYAQLLADYPDHAELEHQLGFIEAHTVSVEYALRRFERAVTLNPGSEQYWVSYIDALARLGDTNTARQAIAHAQRLALSPAYAETLLAEIDQLEHASVAEAEAKAEQLRAEVEAALQQPLQPNRKKTVLAVQKQLCKPVFYIHAPAYTHLSSGVRCLHILCHTLNQLGYESYVSTAQHKPGLNTPQLTTELLQAHQHAQRLQIAVYPEVETGNPLNVPHVVRYMLNHPNFFKKGSWFGHFHADEFILNFPDFALPWLPSSELMIQSIDRAVYHQPASAAQPRKGFLLYEHRVQAAADVIPEWCQPLQVISAKQPRTPEQLAELYRQAEGLILFERSAAAVEALLCGCPVLFSDAYGLDKALTQTADYKDFFSVWNFDQTAYADLLARADQFAQVFDLNQRHAEAHIAVMAERIVQHFSGQDSDVLAMTPVYQMQVANKAIQDMQLAKATLAYRQAMVDFPDMVEPYYQLAAMLTHMQLWSPAHAYLLQGRQRLLALPAHACLDAIHMMFAALEAELLPHL